MLCLGDNSKDSQKHDLLNLLLSHNIGSHKISLDALYRFITHEPINLYILSGTIPIIFLLRITTTSNKCEMLNNLNLKVGRI